MADSSKDIQLRELKDMINDLKKMIKTLQATVDAVSYTHLLSLASYLPNTGNQNVHNHTQHYSVLKTLFP